MGRRSRTNSIIPTHYPERIEQPLDQNQGPTPMGASVFSLANYRQISTLKKTLAANNKGVFYLRSPKSDSNFFFGGRVSPHLCLLAAFLRAP
jgi:hypothetical protein